MTFFIIFLDFAHSLQDCQFLKRRALCYDDFMEPEREEGKPKFRKIAELSTLGLMLPSSIAVGLFFGYYLDKFLGTEPWMLLIFLLLGVASGFMSLLRGIKRLSKP